MAKKQPRRTGRGPRTRAGRDATAARTRAKRPAAGPDPVVTIRFRADGALLDQSLRRDARLVRLAEEWTYRLRSRTRWADDEDLRRSLRGRALEDLESLGVRRRFLQRMASCRHVEVELHQWDAQDPAANRIHEAAADLPWEYLLSTATRGVGRYGSILITRLFTSDKAPKDIPLPPRRILFVESAPGRVEDVYDFESERKRIRAAVGADRQPLDGAAPRVMETSPTENLRQLKQRVRSDKWDALHVTGVDTHQAAWEIDGFYDPAPRAGPRRVALDDDIPDGMILRESNVAELPVPYQAVAAALVNPKYPPALVTLNLYYSGARTAREFVRLGTNAAMGFLDEIDDELAERFFQAFYSEWCRPGSRLMIPEAFVEAWKKMPGDGLHGTAIVIWMGRSVFSDFKRLRRQPGAAVAASATMVEPARLTSRPVRELLQVELDLPAEINYSLLHNDRALLQKLTLTRLVDAELDDISVLVELNLGAQNYPFRCTTQFLRAEPQLALAPLVRIPLTASLPRSLRERVQSTVYVKVMCGDRIAEETTRRVTLIPVDEWVDDTDNNPWLPSFVLPRDPAILAIVNSSRRYLVGIRDDPAAGFDGYQSIERRADQPTAGVDAQVRAIWTALVNEYRLQYINPPPAYSDRNQRLRTPGDILASNTGTCIDLALLLASCLEYIDVYPVLVLLEGHAFVGYWRDDEAHAAFVEVLQIPAEVPAPGSAVARSAAVRFVDQFGWRLTRVHYNEIMQYVTAGDLVMLEATYLTSASSFAEAVAEGRANMRSRREFDSLLDIRLARTATPPVTPLPIINE